MCRFTLLSCLAFTLTSPATAEGDYDNGRKLAKEWSCFECHGLTGNERWPENPTFPSIPMLAGQPAGYLMKTLNEYKARVRIDDNEYSRMSKRVQLLSEQDIEDIAAYFSAQKRY